ncbi:3200_t:CDS:2, partial [Funneliformis mosseae]
QTWICPLCGYNGSYCLEVLRRAPVCFFFMEIKNLTLNVLGEEYNGSYCLEVLRSTPNIEFDSGMLLGMIVAGSIDHKSLMPIKKKNLIRSQRFSRDKTRGFSTVPAYDKLKDVA